MPNDMHIAIPEPISCRKKILETAIETVRDLKKYERLVQLRKEKTIYYNHLRKNIRELKSIMSELDYLPKVKIQGEETKQLKKKTVKTKKQKVQPKPKKKVNRLDKDIEALKARIKSL